MCSDVDREKDFITPAFAISDSRVFQFLTFFCALFHLTILSYPRFILFLFHSVFILLGYARNEYCYNVAGETESWLEIKKR